MVAEQLVAQWPAAAPGSAAESPASPAAAAAVVRLAAAVSPADRGALLQTVLRARLATAAGGGRPLGQEEAELAVRGLARGGGAELGSEWLPRLAAGVESAAGESALWRAQLEELQVTLCARRWRLTTGSDTTTLWL